MNAPPPPKATLIIAPDEIGVFSEHSRINVYDDRPYDVLCPRYTIGNFIGYHIDDGARKYPLQNPYAIIEAFAIDPDCISRVYTLLREININRNKRNICSFREDIRVVSSKHYSLLKKLFCLIRGENHIQLTQDQIKNIFERDDVPYDDHYDSDDDDDFTEKKSSSLGFHLEFPYIPWFPKIDLFKWMMSALQMRQRRCHIEG